jgi:hypothetical protein
VPTERAHNSTARLIAADDVLSSFLEKTARAVVAWLNTEALASPPPQ